MGRRSWIALLLSVPLLVLGLPAPPAAAATQSDPISYAYDDAGRLRAVIDPSAGAGVYSYDAVGNLLSIDRRTATTTSIIEFDPDSGPVGSSVTIYGTGFGSTASQNSVSFNGVAATITSVSTTTLVATVPSGATTGPISVTSPAGSATSSGSFVLTNPPSAPTISGFTPAIGASGTSVTIDGSNFDPATRNDIVTFNGLRAKVTGATPTSVSATVPSYATSGRIRVATPGGEATSSGDFFVPPPSYTASNVGFTGRIAVSETKTMTISTSGTIGMFVFDGTPGNRIGLRTSGASGFGCCQTLKIYNPDGSTLVDSWDWPNRFVDTATLTQAGTYTIVFFPGSQTGSLNFTLYEFTDITGSITPGTPRQLNFTTPGQKAYLTFDGTAGQKASVNFANGTFPYVLGSYAFHAKILRPDGNTLKAQDFTGGGGGFVDAVTLPDTGSYTLVVDPDRELTGNITATLYDVVDITGSITPGTPRTLNFTTPGQNAYLTFTTTQTDQKASVNFTNGTFPYVLGSYAFHAKILKPDGSTLKAQDFTGGGGGFVDAVTLHDPLTYTLVVDPDRELTGNITATLYDVVDITGSITPGTPRTLNFTTPGQNASLTFDATQNGQQASVNFSNGTFPYVLGSYAFHARILNPDGSTLISQDYTSGSSGSIPATTLPAIGTYTLVVDPDRELTGSITATLTLTGGSGGAVAVLSGSSSSGSADGEGQSLIGQTGDGGGEQTAATAPTPSSSPEPPSSAPSWVARFQPPGPEEWIPTDTNLTGYWQTGRPPSPLTQLAPLPVSSDITSVAGQVLTLNGEPLEGVTLELDKQSATTDETGRFVLSDVPSGHQVLEIDGTTANRAGKTYGTFEYGVDLDKEQQNDLPFTIWMPLIDTAHEQSFDSPTAKQVVLTTPKIPGLEVVIPAGSRVEDEDGEPVTKLGITPVPIDRSPFPLPKFFETPVYFTVQPGGAYVFPDGARIIYPNYTHQPPGARGDFWNYDPEDKGWYVYGQGTVSADGTQVIPDPGVKVYEFSGAMFDSGTPPDDGPQCSFWATLFSGCHGGDPVDPQSGLFTSETTDLYLPGPLPISLTRVYRQADPNARGFGRATNFTYGMFMYSAHQYSEADMIMPDGARVHYVRTSSGTGWTDAVFESTSTPGPFYKSTIVWNGNGWDVKLKDGTVYVFGENAPLQAIRDRFGNQITLTRTNGQSGNITQISATGGRWIKLTYDTSNRIIQAEDNAGRIVGYHYDANGRLDRVTDANGGVTRYGWGSCAGTPVPATCNQITTIIDPRDKLVLTNEYDTNQRVKTQTLADGTSKYTFAYTLTNGSVTKTDITDPNGFVRSVSFNADGWTSTETFAKGKTYAQTFTYNRQAGTGLLDNVIDPLGRKTSYIYDPKGNVKSVTRLAGTSGAVTTSFTYDPAFNQLASVTDPLNHSVNYFYNAKGNLTSVEDALHRTSTFTYNSAGQLRTAKDALDHVWTYGYTAGDLTSVTDPLGRTTRRFVDSAGRAVTVIDPLGHVVRRDYDDRNQLTKVTDPLGGTTLFGHDPAGNLKTVTDARQNVTTYGYDDMNRITSRQDGLLKTEIFYYDRNSNLIKFTDRKGQVTTYQYDGLDRRTFVGFGTVAGPKGSTYSSSITYTYDAGNRLKKIVDTRGGTITRDYDDLDRLKTETAPNAPRGGIVYTYDNADRRTTMQVGSLSPVVYGYNNANQLTSITQGTSSVGFDYDAVGRPKTLTLPDGIVQTYGYDDANDVTSISYTKGATTLGDLAYGYDADGRRTAVWGSYGRTSLPAPTTAAASYNANNQLTSWNGTTISYDLNGNLTGYGSQSFTWNDRNQLSATSAGNASFTYDGLGRRLSKTVGGSTTKFLYDGANVVQEQNSSNTGTANLLTGLGIDHTFSRSVVGGATSSLLTDVLGSTIALADVNGAVQTSYTYDPFGVATTSGATNTNSYQFAGRESDGPTGMDYMRARYYAPGFGRFISEDPLGFPGGPDPNVYGYVSDQPTTVTDPFGLDPGNGCGFLGSSCVLHFLEDHWFEIALFVVVTVLTDGLGDGFLFGGEFAEDAVLEIGAEEADLGESIFYHYTDEAGRAGIEAAGEINPGATTGRVFVSSTEYSDAATAQAELALPRSPTGYFEIPESRLPGLTEPSTVDPNVGQPGGGLECWVTCSVDVSGLKFVPFP
jgi:RHS repeat-associated protein